MRFMSRLMLVAITVEIQDQPSRQRRTHQTPGDETGRAHRADSDRPDVSLRLRE
jgi:hypothetical protein